MTKQITLTFAAFAHDLGAHTRLTLDASLVWHREYIDADAVTRKARREEFILNFLIGYLVARIAKPTEADIAKATKRAEKIMAQSRDERSAEDQKVYDAARAKFTYHIVRPEKSGGSARVDIVAQAIALVGKMSAAEKRKFLAAI